MIIINDEQVCPTCGGYYTTGGYCTNGHPIIYKEEEMTELKKDIEKMKIVTALLQGEKIYIDNDVTTRELYYSLVNKGFANYSNNIISKNWKTEYWKPTPALAIPYKKEKINNRFEILDLRL